MSNDPWELHSQIVTYAKGWYVETETMADIKVIIGELCAIETKYIPDLDVLGIVIDTLMFTTQGRETNRDIREVLMEAFKGMHKKPYNPWQKPQESVTMIEIIESSLSLIRQTQTVHLPWWDLKVNGSFLPIATEKRERGIKIGMIYVDPPVKETTNAV